MLQLLGYYLPETLLELCPWTPLGEFSPPSTLNPPATIFQIQHWKYVYITGCYSVQIEYRENI